MTPREMQNAFEREVNIFDSPEIVESDVIFYWLNEAVRRLVNTKYSGVNPKGESFEQTQKRIDDLRTLIRESRLIPTLGIVGINKPNSYIAVLPSDYLYAVGEEVEIQCDDLDGLKTIIKRQGITESTSDTYQRQVSDPYSPHVLHYENAKPLRLFYDSYTELITDGDYSINYYHLRYIKAPLKIYLDGPDCELPVHMHAEVINKAVNLYLENIGDPRYQTNKVELNTNE